MSGRSLHLRDGEWITNRKTDRRNPRRVDPLERPEYVLIFLLPKEVAWSTQPGKYGLVEVNAMGNCRIRSFDKGHVIEQAAMFLMKLGAGQEQLHASAVLQTIHSSNSGRDNVQLVLARGNVTAFYGSGKAKVYFGKKP